MDGEDPIAKLTAREKEVLRAWLAQKTAKEIALDLDISHHAVEKRLKMARLKLDVSSSREAARLLAEAEGYDPAVPQSSDLSDAPRPAQISKHPIPIIGGIAMLLATIAALVLTNADQAVPRDIVWSEGSEVTVNGNIPPIFDDLDRNGSGYLEQPESPFVTLTFVDPQDSEKMEGDAIVSDSEDPEDVAEFYADADTDGDQRVSFREFFTWHREHLAEMGIGISTVVKVRPAPES